MIYVKKHSRSSYVKQIKVGTRFPLESQNAITSAEAVQASRGRPESSNNDLQVGIQQQMLHSFTKTRNKPLVHRIKKQNNAFSLFLSSNILVTLDIYID